MPKTEVRAYTRSSAPGKTCFVELFPKDRARTRIPLQPGVAVRGPPLLDLDLGSGVFELLLDRGGFILVDALFHCLRSAVDQILGFFQA